MAERQSAASTSYDATREFDHVSGYQRNPATAGSPEGQTMIERISRAIAAHHGSDDWRLFLDDARAAAAAMREPTAEMLDAAIEELPDWGQLPEDWRAMIDYVLRERPH